MTQFLAPVLVDAEEELEGSLRPRTLADFVNQERVKDQLSIALERNGHRRIIAAKTPGPRSC